MKESPEKERNSLDNSKFYKNNSIGWESTESKLE